MKNITKLSTEEIEDHFLRLKEIFGLKVIYDCTSHPNSYQIEIFSPPLERNTIDLNDEKIIKELNMVKCRIKNMYNAKKVEYTYNKYNLIFSQEVIIFRFWL